MKITEAPRRAGWARQGGVSHGGGWAIAAEGEHRPAVVAHEDGQVAVTKDDQFGADGAQPPTQLGRPDRILVERQPGTLVLMSRMPGADTERKPPLRDCDQRRRFTRQQHRIRPARARPTSPVVQESVAGSSTSGHAHGEIRRRIDLAWGHPRREASPTQRSGVREVSHRRGPLVAMRSRATSRTCRATTIAFKASVCVASSRSAGYRPSIDHRVSSGSSIVAKALASSSGSRCANRSRSCSLGGSMSRSINRALSAFSAAWCAHTHAPRATTSASAAVCSARARSSSAQRSHR